MSGATSQPERAVGGSDLVSKFARELEAVGGHATVVGSEREAGEKIVAIARAANVRSAAIGQGIATDLDTLAMAMERSRIEVIKAGAVENGERRAVRDRIARCDAGIAEADYGIASTGTLAVTSAASRPGSLTLLPPLSIVIVRAERIVPDLAEMLNAFGAAGVAANRLTLITGPSRTADIEKRIVLGVHGPRELHAIIVQSRDG